MSTKKAAGGGGLFFLIILGIGFFMLMNPNQDGNQNPGGEQRRSTSGTDVDSDWENDNSRKDGRGKSMAKEGWAMDTDSAGSSDSKTDRQNPAAKGSAGKSTAKGGWEMDTKVKTKETGKSSGVDLNLSGNGKSSPKKSSGNGFKMEEVPTKKKSTSKEGWNMEGVSGQKKSNQ